MANQKDIWNQEYKNNKNKWHKETQNLPHFPKDSKVLELGVGNGKTLKAVIKQTPKEIVAIDFSKEAINLAKSNKLFKEVKFIEANINNLPFKDNYFDIIFCHYVLNNLTAEEIIQAIKEIYRTLKQKGKIYFQDFAAGDFRQKPLNKEIEKSAKQNKSGLFCHFFTEQELINIFSNFSKVKIKEKTTTPITHKPNLKRRIISALITK